MKATCICYFVVPHDLVRSTALQWLQNFTELAHANLRYVKIFLLVDFFLIRLTLTSSRNQCLCRLCRFSFFFHSNPMRWEAFNSRNNVTVLIHSDICAESPGTFGWRYLERQEFLLCDSLGMHCIMLHI